MAPSGISEITIKLQMAQKYQMKKVQSQFFTIQEGAFSEMTWQLVERKRYFT